MSARKSQRRWGEKWIQISTFLFLFKFFFLCYKSSDIAKSVSNRLCEFFFVVAKKKQQQPHVEGKKSIYTTKEAERIANEMFKRCIHNNVKMFSIFSFFLFKYILGVSRFRLNSVNQVVLRKFINELCKWVRLFEATSL